MLKRLVLFATVLFIPAFAFSITIYVPDDHPSIQDAIDDSANGDVIIVRSGVYHENINFLDRSISIVSESGPGSTIIDGNQLNSVVIISNNQGLDTRLEGFTLTNGNGKLDSYGFREGGGIYCEASPTIKGNHIRANSVTYSGGGIYYDGAPWIVDNVITLNTAVYNGGGIFGYGSPNIELNTISSNKATGDPSIYDCSGGGICCNHGNPVITNNLITGNMANDYHSSLDGFGGGIYCFFSEPTISDNLIKGNHIAWGYGAGICCYGCKAVISNNMITVNTVSQAFSGGGLYLDGGQSMMVNNVIHDNYAPSGGGISCYFSSPQLVFNTIVDNSCNTYGGYGGGIYNSSGHFEIVNSILWGNVNSQIANPSGTVTVSFSNVQDGWSGVGNIDADPLFVDAGSLDFHLTYLSLSRNTGDNATMPVTTDYDGNPRKAYGSVDMGADEFSTHFYITGDQTPGGAIQAKFVGLPGTTPVGLFIGSGILPSPIPTMWGEYWLQAPWFLFTLIPIPSNGILELPTTLPGSIPAPYDIPMQALIGLNADSLTNVCVLEVR